MSLFDFFKRIFHITEPYRGKHSAKKPLALSAPEHPNSKPRTASNPYPSTIDRLGHMSISGLTFEKEGDMSLGKYLTASTRKGNRENQEDAVLLLKKGNLKMMVVSDGMGGEEYGEVASNIVITRLKQWFDELNNAEIFRYRQNVQIAQDVLNSKIQEISDEVRAETKDKGGATLVCAIIGDTQTLVTNVGDSRAYIMKNGKLEQISRDDSLAQLYFDTGIIQEKGYMRFHKSSSVLLTNIGDTKAPINPNHQIVNNIDFDMLLLCSDGVTDCLPEKRIAYICKNTNKNHIAKELVKSALAHKSIVPAEIKNDEGYDLEIPAGKDNATVALYTPKENER